jgi:shikimate dehydrogenase
MISGKARVCGLMGCPVEHSLSPLLHNFFAGEMGMDFAYVPFLVSEGDVKAAVNGAWALNVAGMNVTIPHKQSVIPFLTDLDPGARLIGAVNTMVRTKDGYKGYNTDASGLLRAMKEADMDIAGKDWLLFGAGGAAKAAAFVLGSENARQVVILNRSRDRALDLAREMNRKLGREFLTALALEDYKKLPEGQWQALQTTSVGMAPRAGRAVIEDKGFYSRISQAMDVIYTPARTRFMELVEEAGGRAVNGLDMLLYQGAAAFELWNPDIRILPQTMAQARPLMETTLRGRESGA